MSTEQTKQTKSNEAVVVSRIDQLRKEGRAVVIRFAQWILVDIFNWRNNPPGFIAVPVTDELPHDVIVDSVSSHFGSRSIEMLVYHESFDPTLPGSEFKRTPDFFTEIMVVPLEEVSAAESDN